MRARFSVSRAALLEAYNILRAKALIGSRPKIDARIRAKTEWNRLDQEVARRPATVFWRRSAASSTRRSNAPAG